MTSGQIIFLIPLYLAAINVIAYFSFYTDKKAATLGRRRIPESTLLSMAFLGGSLGCVLAQQKFRHKTRKQPFKFQLYFIVVLQATLLVAICFPKIRRMVFTVFMDLMN